MAEPNVYIHSTYLIRNGGPRQAEKLAFNLLLEVSRSIVGFGSTGFGKLGK